MVNTGRNLGRRDRTIFRFCPEGVGRADDLSAAHPGTGEENAGSLLEAAERVLLK